MNYFTHALNHLDRPYFMAGTASPDWLSVADRKVRLRPRQLDPWLDSSDEIQAAVLRTRLPFLDQENARRREIATVYNRAFAQSGLRLPEAPANAEPVYHQYVVRHPDREALAGHLRWCGIGTSIHYPVPIHLQPAYLERARPASLAETESA